ncbi:MAG TPA: hypothetical protein VLD65_09735 [Anaerolineales bacterium]|nr:hypothetical protein [Anaerolineales bacterium]
MLNLIEFMMITEMAKMKQENLLNRCDWMPEHVKSAPIQLSMIDRITDSAGEVLISCGKKLKQHSHARLNAEQAQAPNIMIML